MTTDHIHTHTAASTGQGGTSAPKKGLLAGIGVTVACALACSLPLIAGAGVFAAVGALAEGAEIVGVALVAAVAAGWLLLRRRKAKSAEAGGCGCAGGC